MKSYLGPLSLDLFQHVLGSLGLVTFCRAAQVNRAWRDAAQSVPVRARRALEWEKRKDALINLCPEYATQIARHLRSPRGTWEVMNELQLATNSLYGIMDRNGSPAVLVACATSIWYKGSSNGMQKVHDILFG